MKNLKDWKIRIEVLGKKYRVKTDALYNKIDIYESQIDEMNLDLINEKSRYNLYAKKSGEELFKIINENEESEAEKLTQIQTQKKVLQKDGTYIDGPRAKENNLDAIAAQKKSIQSDTSVFLEAQRLG